MKDFDKWSILKRKIELNSKETFCHKREIWWCSIGLNIGVEIDGKNESFERPVLVFKIYNMQCVLVFPISSKGKEDKFHFKISNTLNSVHKYSYVKVSQLRIISTKRLIRKIGYMNSNDFNSLKCMILKSLE